MEDLALNNPPVSVAAPVTPVTETLPPAAEPSPIPLKKSFLKLIVIIIAIVIVIVGSVLLYKKNSSSVPNLNQKSQDKTKSGGTGPQARQPGLKIYENSSNKFSVQYPDELQVQEKPVGMGVTTVELRSEDNLNEDYLADIQMMTIPKYLAKAIGQDFDEYYKMSDNTSKTITAEDKSQVLIKVKNRSINDLRAFDFKSTGETEDEGTTIGVYVEMGDKILIISTQEENKEELETMLSNFRYNP